MAASTGISIQAVLKHLRKLEELGLAEEKSVRSPNLAVRKVYTAKGAKLGDFSAGDLRLVKLSRKPSEPTREPDRCFDLEYLAEEAIFRRRRVRNQTRRLGRMIDDLVEDESKFKTALESMDLSDTERLILQVLFRASRKGSEFSWSTSGCRTARSRSRRRSARRDTRQRGESTDDSHCVGPLGKQNSLGWRRSRKGPRSRINRYSRGRIQNWRSRELDGS